MISEHKTTWGQIILQPQSHKHIADPARKSLQLHFRTAIRLHGLMAADDSPIADVLWLLGCKPCMVCGPASSQVRLMPW